MQWTRHATRQAYAKGFFFPDVSRAARDPQVTYPNGRYPGQERRIRDGIVAVVDPERNVIITVYENITETDLRPDQTDEDARRYAARKGARK